MYTPANFVSNALPTHDAQAQDAGAYLFLAVIYTLVAAALPAAPRLGAGTACHEGLECTCQPYARSLLLP